MKDDMFSVALFLEGPGCQPRRWRLCWRCEGALPLCCPLWMGWPRKQRGPASLHAHRQRPPGLSSGPQCQPWGELCVLRHVCVRRHRGGVCVFVSVCKYVWVWVNISAGLHKKQIARAMWMQNVKTCECEFDVEISILCRRDWDMFSSTNIYLWYEIIRVSCVAPLLKLIIF